MPAPERHINSSCDPNTYVTTRSDGRHVVALRPIAARSEITYDYMINPARRGPVDVQLRRGDLSRRPADQLLPAAA